MHCLVGTFIKEIEEEHNPEDGSTLYPIKIFIPPNKSRVIYYKSKESQKEWADVIKQTIGYSNLFDFYDLTTTLGEGQFGLVKLANHKNWAKSLHLAR